MLNLIVIAIFVTVTAMTNFKVQFILNSGDVLGNKRSQARPAADGRQASRRRRTSWKHPQVQKNR